MEDGDEDLAIDSAIDWELVDRVVKEHEDALASTKERGQQTFDALPIAVDARAVDSSQGAPKEMLESMEPIAHKDKDNEVDTANPESQHHEEQGLPHQGVGAKGEEAVAAAKAEESVTATDAVAEEAEVAAVLDYLML